MRALFYTTVLSVFLIFSSYGQSPKVNKITPQVIVFNSNTKTAFTDDELAKLQEVYGDALSSEILSRPSRVLSIKEILRNRVILKKISKPDAQKPCPLLSEVPLFDAFVSNLTRDKFFDPKTFNPLKYNFSFSRRGIQLFRVDQTDYFILIKPQHYNKKP